MIISSVDICAADKQRVNGDVLSVAQSRLHTADFQQNSYNKPSLARPGRQDAGYVMRVQIRSVLALVIAMISMA